MVSVRSFKVGGSFNLKAMREEVRQMTDVLVGREAPPMDSGVSTLMEVAEAYHARAREMESMIHEAEADGFVTRGSKIYRFRTGQLRSFIELAKGAIDMGSRRITVAQMELRQEEGW